MNCGRRIPAAVLVCGLAIWPATAGRAATIFQVSSFANPTWSLTYFGGFSGTVGATATWPAEMGWQGDDILIAFNLPAGVPDNALNYTFSINVNLTFAQSFTVTVQAGSDSGSLVQVSSEFVNSPRTVNATIPLSRFVAGQTNWLRIKGVGVLVGNGQPSGIQWNSWTLSRVDTVQDLYTFRMDQLGRMSNYLRDAIQPSGLVRDSLTLSPSDPPFHPASPDAAGFDLVGLCIEDQVGLMYDAPQLAEQILSAYAGHTPGVTPLRNTKGMWYHWLNLTNGGSQPGWTDTYTPIGSALLVAGALFAKNHFIEYPQIGALADELFASVDFDSAIHPSLDGRVYVGQTSTGAEQFGSLTPWSEYMMVVSLARRQPGATRAPAMAVKWTDPVNAPKRSYNGISTLTDNVNSYAPAFWVQYHHFLNSDFAANASFETYFNNHRLADKQYCTSLGQTYRYGLTAGVDPTGYFADRIASHHNVFSPEAVSAWGDIAALLQFAADQPPDSNVRFRYGLTRVSSTQPSWIPNDAGLVDHTLLMFGLMESIDGKFFRLRQFGQADADGDGRADAVENCPSVWNPQQTDENGDGFGDACDCPTPRVDYDRDGDVDLADYAKWQVCSSSRPGKPDACQCFDDNADHLIRTADFAPFASCLEGSGPGAAAAPNCAD